MARTTLVIGGTRNLGPELVAALLRRGDTVAVLNRGQTPDDLPGDVERLRADRSDAGAMQAALGGRSFDVVVDTTLYAGREAEAIISLLDGRAGRYVFWSTGQVYLVRTGLTPPFAERDYDGPVMAEPPKDHAVDHDNWVYGVDKRAAEDAFAAALAARRFPYVSLRMPMINSARDHYRRLASYVHRLRDGGPIVVPDDQDRLALRHVFAGDVVAATLRAAEASVTNVTCVNVSQDESLKLENMLGMVGQALGIAPRLARMPREVLVSRGLLPACSPWSGRWMSVLDNGESKRVLGMRYAAPKEYLPGLVAEALKVPEADVPGYARRAEELELAKQ